MATTLLKPTPLFLFRAGARPAITTLHPTRHATTSSTPPPPADPLASRRRAITIANDTGRVPWTQLSRGEKAARTTQQTLNLGLVLLGAGLTATVAYVLYLEVFSTDSKTAVFNRAADRVRKDPECLRLLCGEGMHTKREVEAHGEPSWSRWARNRTIASRHETDRAGVEHTHLHFYVKGAEAEGTVRVHVAKRPEEREWEYRMLALDVPGRQRYYLENAEAGLVAQRKQGKMFGVRWN
ncbi:hypothetical protein LTR08_007249 [Meristemomyces frigidus]|nr:hypothetical protein LTR08_007249 [Meristemomyces frigidus]